METNTISRSFGFTIAKFFEFEQKRGGTFTPVLGPQTVGTLMIAIGVFSLLLATRQHLKSLKTLNQRCPGLPKSLARYTAGGLALLGLLAFVAALIRG